MNETPNKNEQHTRPRIVKSKPGSGNIKKKNTGRKNLIGRQSGSKTINQDLGIKELKRKSSGAEKDNFALVKKNLRRSQTMSIHMKRSKGQPDDKKIIDEKDEFFGSNSIQFSSKTSNDELKNAVSAAEASQRLSRHDSKRSHASSLDLVDQPRHSTMSPFRDQTTIIEANETSLRTPARSETHDNSDSMLDLFVIDKKRVHSSMCTTEFLESSSDDSDTDSFNTLSTFYHNGYKKRRLHLKFPAKVTKTLYQYQLSEIRN